MSRTIFLNACARLKVECTHALDFERVDHESKVIDAIGQFVVPAWHFIATYMFSGCAFRGSGSTKKAATEHLFSRLIASEYMPTTPERLDPTEGLDATNFVLFIDKESRTLSLNASDASGKIVFSTGVTPAVIPRGRHESVMSLIRHVMRETENHSEVESLTELFRNLGK